MRDSPQWRWHLDEVFVRVNGEMHYLWRAVDHEGEVLEAFVTKRRDRKAALRFLKKAMKRYGNPLEVVTDRLRSYRATMKEIGNAARQETGRWLNNRRKTRINRSGAESERWQSSGVRSRYRNSSQYTCHSTTTSIKNDTSTTVRPSNSNDRSRYQSSLMTLKVGFLPRLFLGKTYT